MAITDVADQYFTYESRLASFQTAQQLSKGRTSNANSKAPKTMKWPHKFLSPEELAKAGFFYYPLQVNPDNVACFLCNKSLDGWEKDDDPLVEHLKHSPNCGWALVATIEKQDGDLRQEYPSSTRMIEARRATFADKWPHDSKKGWKCKVKQMVDAGWKYTPTPECDDTATCTYCSLALDGWEPSDKPLDEHFKRSPDCSFFSLIENHKQSPAAKRTKTKKDRTSKASRLSTQSSFTVASEAPSLADLPAEEEDSILTTATNATATQGGRRMGKGKKAATAKGKKTKAKKSEVVEVLAAPEAEDADFDVKVDVTPKAARGRKRKSGEMTYSAAAIVEIQPPPAKRRVTRTRGSIAADHRTLFPDQNTSLIDAEDAPKPHGRSKGRSSVAKSTRKASAASVTSLQAAIPDYDEIDAVLKADLERPLTDNEDEVAQLPKKGTRSSKITKFNQAMFGTEPMDVDEAAIEAELQAMEAESKILPKAKSLKGKQPRKVSAKQQGAARKAAEAEAEAQRLAEEAASQQIVSELDHSLSMKHSSPIVQPKRQSASSRQPLRQLLGRSTRASGESNMPLVDDFQDAASDQKDELCSETDVSVSSQSTAVRGGSTHRGSTTEKGRGGKKAASRNIEEIVLKSQDEAANEVLEELTSIQKKIHSTQVPEVPKPVVEESISQETKPKAAKVRGRPKAPQASPTQGNLTGVDSVQAEAAKRKSNAAKGRAATPPRSETRPLKEITPAASPQSSDAENRPPSSKPSASTRKPSTPHSTTTRIALAASTPIMSPSKRNVIAGLQSAYPWSAVDLDAIFLKSPSDENALGKGILGDALEKVNNGELTSPEKKMTVEEWIHFNAEMAEEELRNECERMVGSFEREGGRAMRALEGVECVE